MPPETYAVRRSRTTVVFNRRELGDETLDERSLGGGGVGYWRARPFFGRSRASWRCLGTASRNLSSQWEVGSRGAAGASAFTIPFGM